MFNCPRFSFQLSRFCLCCHPDIPCETEGVTEPSLIPPRAPPSALLGEFVDVFQGGLITEGYVLSTRNSRPFVLTVVNSKPQTGFFSIAEFRSATQRSSLSSDLLLGLSVDLTPRTDDLLQKCCQGVISDTEVVQLFAGLLPLGLAQHYRQRRTEAGYRVYESVFVEFFRLVHGCQISQECIARVLASVAAAEALWVAAGDVSHSSRALVAHLGAIAGAEITTKIVASFRELANVICPNDEKTKHYQWHSLARVKSAANYVALEPFAAAACRYLQLCVRMQQADEALETLCLLLWAAHICETRGAVSHSFVTESITAMRPFFERNVASSCQKSQIMHLLLAAPFLDSHFSLDFFRAHALLDTQSCKYFFANASTEQCLALLQRGEETRFSGLSGLEDVPSESKKSLKRLLQRASPSVQLQICECLRVKAVIWKLPKNRAAAKVAARMEKKALLWMRKKGKWGALPSGVVREIFTYC